MAKLFLAGTRLDFMRAREEERAAKTPVPAVLADGFIRRVLASYYYDGFQTNNVPSEEVQSFAKLGLDLFLDSGAFSAFTQKITIPLEKYADFVRKHGEAFSIVASLDAIGSDEASAAESYANFQKLTDLGAAVSPAWHTREPVSWLEKYLAEGHAHILIGGMVTETSVSLRERLDWLFANVLTDKSGRPLAKYHGFGITSWKLLPRYPWFSVDSTAWLKRAYYGMIVMPMGAKRFVDVTLSDQSPRRFEANSWHYQNLTPPQQQQVEEFVAGYKMTVGELASNWRLRAIANQITYQNMEASIPDRFEQEVQMTLC